MERKKRIWLRRAFAAGFIVLTFFCWCPLGYGSYGPARRFLGIPYWAAIALALGVVLFALEWVYLFATGFAITDEGLAEVVSELEKVDIDGSTEVAPVGTASGKGDE